MYKPYGENIYCYDVNALYPTMMHNKKFPVGPIRVFQGDIEWLYILDPNYSKDNTYWIGNAKVSTKKDLYQPYLQVNHLGKANGLNCQRTIAPNGSFNMKINCVEYYNALKDYNIEIVGGLLFDSENIFEPYVQEMYTTRQQFTKDQPMNYICKLLLNSLYGRFAMKPVDSFVTFIDKNDNELIKLTAKYDILDMVNLDDNTLLVTYSPKKGKVPVIWKSNDDNEGNDFFINSIPVASAVTAYARIFMSEFKNNPKYTLYYTDTDSAFVDKELDLEFIGRGLGLFKLEYVFKEAVFLGPKIYAGITTDNKYICKIKGFKNPSMVSFDMMKDLLYRDSIAKLSHVKWFRGINEIQMKNQVYELVMTNNKRDFIFKDGVIKDTMAFSFMPRSTPLRGLR